MQKDRPVRAQVSWTKAQIRRITGPAADQILVGDKSEDARSD